MKIVTNKKMEEIDRLSQEEFSFPSLCLMENAGIKAWHYLKKRYSLDGLIVFVAGKGNNGGDALVMARQCYLDGKKEICIVLAAGEPAAKTDPALNLAACRALQLEVIDYEQQTALAQSRLQAAAWLVDGVFGTGLKGELRSPVRELVSELNKSPAKKIAIDVPSGIGDQFKSGYIAFQADLTLTMGLPKHCLYLPYARSYCGQIVVIKLGFPPALTEDESIPGEMLRAKDFLARLPAIPPTTYKTKRGHLAVFAGSVGTSGAAWLCAHAAARSRTGLVTYFADEEIYPLVAGSYSSVIVHCWNPGSGTNRMGRDLTGLEDYSAFLAGPGWGLAPEKQEWLAKLLATDKPGVIDADGLRMLASQRGNKAYKPGPTRVLTPHPGEFSVFTDSNIKDVLTDPLTALKSLCMELNTNVILKGHVTYIMAPDGRYGVLDGMNPALATGGAGDVLAGIVAGFLAQGVPAYEAACAGAMLHAYIGKNLYRRKGWFLAQDMLALISPSLAAGSLIMNDFVTNDE